MSRTVSLPHDLTVTVEQPYAEGYVLTAVEAEKLNHVLADSIRTSLTAKLKRLADLASKAGEDFDASALAAEFQSFADAYTFSARAKGTGRASADPVEKLALKIAKEQVHAAIRNKGGNPSDYSAEQIAEYVAKVLHHKPEIREEAIRRVESSRKMATDMLADLIPAAAE